MKKVYTIRMVVIVRDGVTLTTPEYVFLDSKFKNNTDDLTYKDIPPDSKIKLVSQKHFSGSPDLFYEMLLFDKDTRIGFLQSTFKKETSDEEIRKDIDIVYNDDMDDEVYAKKVAFDVIKNGPTELNKRNC